MSSKKKKKTKINKKLKAIRSRAVGIARSKKTWIGLILSLIIILTILVILGVGSYLLYKYVISPWIWPNSTNSNGNGTVLNGG